MLIIKLILIDNNQWFFENIKNWAKKLLSYTNTKNS